MNKKPNPCSFVPTNYLTDMEYYEMNTYKEWRCWVFKDSFVLKHKDVTVVNSYKKFKNLKTIILDFYMNESKQCCSECGINISNGTNYFNINIQKKDLDGLVLFLEKITIDTDSLRSQNKVVSKTKNNYLTESSNSQFWTKNGVINSFKLN